jgi:ribosomal protein S21
MAVNVRVEARPISSDASWDQKDRAFKAMMAAFKRKVNESGIMLEYSRKQSYESKGQKRRRKLKEAIARRRKEEWELKFKLRDRFGNVKKKPVKKFKKPYGPRRDTGSAEVHHA